MMIIILEKWYLVRVVIDLNITFVGFKPMFLLDSKVNVIKPKTRNTNL